MMRESINRVRDGRRGAGRVLVTSAVAVTVAASLAACSSGGSDSSSGSGSGSTKVAAVIKGLDNTFFQTMQSGIDDQAKAASVTVDVQAAQSITDTTGQADKLNALAQQDFGCFIVNPISDNNLVQGLATIAAKNVPVVNIDRPVDADAAKAAGVDIATYIGTDNTDAGKTAGTQMSTLVGGTGKVGVIGGVAGDITSGERVTGFGQGATGLTLLPTQAADWDRQKALTIATDLLNSNPDLVGILAANDDMGLGAAKAISDAGKTGKVKVISVDGNKDALEAIQAGTLTGTVSQYPYAVGQMGVEACQQAMAGKSLPESVKAPIALVTSDNVADAISNFPKTFEPFEDPLASNS